MQQGTLSADGATFTPGTGAADTDFRLSCTGEGAADDIDTDDLVAAITAFGGEAFDAIEGPDTQVVLEIGGSGAAVNLSKHPEFGREWLPIVVRGTVRGAGDKAGFNVYRNDLAGALYVDSYADVRTTGGARGLLVGIDGETDGRVRLRNFGRVVTTGEGTAETPRRGYGMYAWSEQADLEVSNEAGATIETRGAGGRGLYATTNRGAAAKAVNRGTVITKGGPSGDRRAEGVRADSGGSVAEAVNEADATVRTEGDGARGVLATLCYWTGESCRPGRSGGTATAINRGAVTVTGHSVTVDDRTLQPYGVSASVHGGGTARAVNEAGATIRTEGDGARGLHANHDGAAGRAEAENQGAIVTTGNLAQSGRRQADGLTAWSKSRSVYAVNHQGATISTEGIGAEGIDAAVGRGGAGTSAVAVNHGTIRTSGGAFWNESLSRHSTGMGVYTGFDGALSAARVEAVNETTGVIETRGDAARGVFAHIGADGSGAAEATNRGRITTRGNVLRVDRAGEDDDYWLGAHGVNAATYGSGAVTATNEVGGIVETHGTVAYGLAAWSDGAGAAKAVNKGRVTTHQLEAVPGEPSDVNFQVGARGAWAFSRSGNAAVENEPTGRVETRGARAFGLYAQIEGDGSRTSVMAEARNRGTVITGGWNADGVIAIATRGGGTAANPSVVRAYNEAGATITTAGDGSGALGAGVQVSGSGTVDAFGSLRAENHGTIETSGGVPGLAPFSGAFGVSALFFKYADSTTIGNAGDVDVVNTGRITVSGPQAVGLQAVTFGTGTATVTMTGGRVAATRGDDPDTADVDEGGFGIWAESGGAGTVEVTVSGSAEVTAPTAVRIAGGAGADRAALNLFGTSTLTGLADLTGAANGSLFTIRGSFMDGAVRFGAGDDGLRIERRGYVSGAIDFGEGTDTLTLDVEGAGVEATGFGGAIRGLEYLYKRGAGVARIGDVAFSGSTLALEEGGLTVAGHLDLGAEGTVTVHDGSRLAIEVGDVTVDAADHGRITAGGGVIYQGQEAPALYVQVAADAAANREGIEAALQESPIAVLGEGTEMRQRADADSEPSADAEVVLKTSGAGGEAQDVGVLSGGTARVQLAEGQRLGVAANPEPPAPAPEPSDAPAAPAASEGGGGSSSKSGALLIGGGALLAAYLFDLFDAEEAAFADWEEESSRRRTSVSFAGPGAGHFEERRVRIGGLEQWTRAFAGRSPSVAGGAEGTIRGIALGLDARFARGFHFGMAAMPDLTVSSPAGAASGFDAGIEGGWYAVRGGWRTGALFADTSLSHGSYRAGSVIENPAAGGVLGGGFDLVQDHARARAGVRLELGGLRATPSVALFSGSLRQSAYTAHGGALRAEVPGISQRYRGWKARLDLAPSGWREGPGVLRWRPGVHLSATRTRTRGPAWLDVPQSDRAGVLSFASRARVAGLPRTVHGFGASLAVKRSDTWRFRAGYAGMMVDGEPVHAVVAGLKVRF